MWDSVSPTENWMKTQIPDFIRDGLFSENKDPGLDMEQLRSGFSQNFRHCRLTIPGSPTLIFWLELVFRSVSALQEQATNQLLIFFSIIVNILFPRHRVQTTLLPRVCRTVRQWGIV